MLWEVIAFVTSKNYSENFEKFRKKRFNRNMRDLFCKNGVLNNFTRTPTGG